ncbi:MAG TPA: hypothetical protein VIR57_23210 [Chloroflexota bacterium]|jgi:hypothetical protein
MGDALGPRLRLADHVRASLVVHALRTAAGRIHLPEGAIFDFGRGSQYTSTALPTLGPNRRHPLQGPQRRVL